MTKKYRPYKIELTAIYMVSLALVLSLCGLTKAAVEAGSTINVESLYPNLQHDCPPDIATTSEKTAYFTFDDGPSHNTEKILDILAEENIKATFFVCAQGSDNVDAPAIMRRIIAEGHEIGLHSYSHDYNKIYRSLDGYLKDLNAINDYVYNATSYKSGIVRFPGGSGTKNASPALIKQISDEVLRRGYRFYDWDVDSGDAISKGNSPESMAQKIAKGTKGRHRIIVLMHDTPTMKSSPKALRLAIPKLREQGYVFDKLTSCVDPAKHFS